MKKFEEISNRDIANCQSAINDLIDFVQEHNNFIDMRNMDGNRCNCYGILYDMGLERYIDCRILALTTFECGEELGILITKDDDMANEYDNLSVDELLESDTWFSSRSEQLWLNATIMSICACVEQFV